VCGRIESAQRRAVALTSAQALIGRLFESRCERGNKVRLRLKEGSAVRRPLMNRKPKVRRLGAGSTMELSALGAALARRGISLPGVGSFAKSAKSDIRLVLSERAVQ